MNDSFLSIAAPCEGLYKAKGSKFIAYAFPVTNEEEIKNQLEQVRKNHHSARHHCYAWRIGAGKRNFRMNDDGEPSFTAGKPILGQIRSFDLTNILIIVVRYFGGTLLGVSGLINAYKSAAADALKEAEIVEQFLMIRFVVRFDYPRMGEVMRFFSREGLSQEKVDFQIHCSIISSIRQKHANNILSDLNAIPDVTAKQID